MGKLPGRPLMTIVKLISFRYLHFRKKIMFHKGLLNLSPFKCALSQEVKKKKAPLYLRNCRRDGVGWGSCLCAPNENCKS